MTNQEAYEIMCHKAEKYDKMVDVLDKIRAEIESIYKEDMECDGCSDMGMVLDIIDKYKGEPE